MESMNSDNVKDVMLFEVIRGTQQARECRLYGFILCGEGQTDHGEIEDKMLG